MRLIAAALIASLLPACGGASPYDPVQRADATKPSPVLGETFTLRSQESATLQGEGLTLLFSRVVNDSRCPAGVQCIWEGNAEVEVSASKPPEPSQMLSLNTNSRFATQASYLGYRIDLIELRPCPDTDHAGGAADQCIGLKVIKPERE